MVTSTLSLPVPGAVTARSSAWRGPALAVLAALAIRFLLLWISHRYEDAAHGHYVSWGIEAVMVARSLGMGNGFSGPFPHYPFVTAWLAPVYPWLVSLGLIIFRMDGHRLMIFAQILNILFSGLTCFPIYFLGKRTSGPKIGLAAAWLWAFLPVAILMPIEWTWDQSLSALLLAVLVCFTYVLCESSSSLHWAGYGLLWALAALTNPALCIVLPFVGLWLWVQRWKKRMPSTGLIARAALFFILALVPWTARNLFELGSITFVKSNFGLELWLGNNSAVKEIYTADQHPLKNYEEYRLLVLAGEPAYNRIKQRQALAFIRDNPATFANLCWHRFVDTWTAAYDPAINIYIPSSLLRKIYVEYTVLFSLAAFAGMIVALRTNATESLPVILVVVIFPISYYITHSSMRYRHPIDPLLTVLAVLGFARVWEFMFARKN